MAGNGSKRGLTSVTSSVASIREMPDVECNKPVP